MDTNSDPIFSIRRRTDLSSIKLSDWKPTRGGLNTSERRMNLTASFWCTYAQCVNLCCITDAIKSNFHFFFSAKRLLIKRLLFHSHSHPHTYIHAWRARVRKAHVQCVFDLCKRYWIERYWMVWHCFWFWKHSISSNLETLHDLYACNNKTKIAWQHFASGFFSFGVVTPTQFD